MIFDLPPMLGSDDALSFAPQVDAVLLVIAEERTRVEDAAALLRADPRDRPVIGTVLNGSRRERQRQYAY